MERAATLLICCAAQDCQEAELLAEKLTRRGWDASIQDCQSANRATGDVAAIAILLSPALLGTDGIARIFGEFTASGIPMFAFRYAGVPLDSGLEPVLAKALRVNAEGHDINRDLSRFANEISARLGGMASQPELVAGMPAAHSQPSGWDWGAFLLGPAWTIRHALPVAGFFCFAFLVVAVSVAATLEPGPLAPLLAFVSGWLALALGLGAMGRGMLAAHQAQLDQTGRPADVWFRPLGAASALAVLALTGFFVLQGSWSGAGSQTDAALAATASPATAIDDDAVDPTNPVRVGSDVAEYQEPLRIGADAGGLGMLPDEETGSTPAPLVLPGMPEKPAAKPDPAPGAPLRSAPVPTPDPDKPNNDANILDDIFDVKTN